MLANTVGNTANTMRIRRNYGETTAKLRLHPPYWPTLVKTQINRAAWTGENRAIVASELDPTAVGRLSWQEGFLQAVKLHLALFYLYGSYFHISKRIVGVRYKHVGRAQDTTPRWVAPYSHEYHYY
eukprot:1179404-Prorocentrum_minimum.AAC.3